MPPRPITVSEAANILNNLNHIPTNNEQIKKYLDTFTKINTQSDTSDLRNTIIQYFNEEQVAIIGSLLPKTVEEFKAYIKECEVTDDVIMDILKITQKHA